MLRARLAGLLTSWWGRSFKRGTVELFGPSFAGSFSVRALEMCAAEATMAPRWCLGRGIAHKSGQLPAATVGNPQSAVAVLSQKLILHWFALHGALRSTGAAPGSVLQARR